MSISQKLENTPPVMILGFALLAGLVLMMGSTACGVSQAHFPDKELGYFHEINWSLNYICFVPLALYFFFSSFNEVRQVIYSLAAAGMIVDSKGIALNSEHLMDDWRVTADRVVRIAIVLGVLIFAASWIEWWINFNYSDDTLANVIAKTGLGEGWNLAPVSIGGNHHIGLARVFGFFAFGMQGIFAASYLGFLSVIFGFATWLFRFTTDATPCELIPDLQSKDTRRGFEAFETLVNTLLYSALCCFGVFFLMRLDHAFLDAPGISTLGAFVHADMVTGFFDGVKTLTTGSGTATLFDTGNIGYTVQMALTGLILSLVTCFFIPSVLLRRAAQFSKKRALIHDPATSEILDTMTFWPISYPRPLHLTALLFVAAMCFVYYHLTLILVATALGVILTKFVKSFK